MALSSKVTNNHPQWLDYVVPIVIKVIPSHWPVVYKCHPQFTKVASIRDRGQCAQILRQLQKGS